MPRSIACPELEDVDKLDDSLAAVDLGRGTERTVGVDPSRLILWETQSLP